MSTRSVNSSIILIWGPTGSSDEGKHQELHSLRIKTIPPLFRSYVLPVQFSADFSLTTILIINKANSFPSVVPDKDVFGASFTLNERCYSISLCAILKETSLNCDQYLLRLAQTVRMDLTSGLGIDVSEVGSLESWVEQAEESGWHVFLDDDEDCEGNEMDSTESQQVTGKSAEVTSGK